MNAILKKLSPSATDLIRADHTRVLGLFHRYSLTARPAVKQALVGTVCLALEVHAQVEEEIFYPAMEQAGSELTEELVPEHDEMRALIETLRGMDPADARFDHTFMDLMRAVIHHVADEETMMLTHAESVLGERLYELGAQMRRRRLQLTVPHAAEMARNSTRAAPKTMLMAAGALLAGAALFRRWRRHA